MSYAESNAMPLEWGAALLLAALLHLAPLAGLPEPTWPSGGARAGGEVAKTTRIGLALAPARNPVTRARLAPKPAPTPRTKPTPKNGAPAVAPKPAPKPPLKQGSLERATQALREVQPHAAAPSAPIAAFTAGAPGDRPEAPGGGIPSPSAGTRGSGEPGVGSAIHANYFDALFLKVVDALDYPRRARLEEIEGTVVLDLRIDRSGRLAHGAIALSSGSRLLDRHALRIARRAAPFGPVPEALEDSELSFELPVEFQLED